MTTRPEFPQPAAWYDRLAVRQGIWEDCEGVPLAIASLRDEAVTRAHVASALRLLRTHAQLDVARIQRLMRGIVVTRLYGSSAEWRQSIQACILSTHFVNADETSAEAIAAIIIHELMHARLDARGFAYDERRRARIERICYRASERFLARLPDSRERDAAAEAIAYFLLLPDSEWSDAALKARSRQRPWYFRTLRFILRGFRSSETRSACPNHSCVSRHHA